MTGPDTTPVVELRQVTVEYTSPTGTVRALDRTDLAVCPTQSIAVVGRSGSGKSSLISVLGLMRTPSSGQVLLDGVQLRPGPRAMRAARARTVGMVFQSFHLEDHLTFVENCMLSWYCTSRSLSARKAMARAIELAELVGLPHLAHRRAAAMSGGERQRTAIARALFSQPRLLVADEPTGNLDEETAAMISDLLWSLPEATGAAVVVVTHDKQVTAGADTIMRLVKGQAKAPATSETKPRGKL